MNVVEILVSASGSLRATVAAALLAAACTTAPVGTPADGAPDVPAGAVPVGPELYQVPVGRDADGCVMYRLHSPTLMVAQVISYRTAAGGFTTDKAEADCG